MDKTPDPRLRTLPRSSTLREVISARDLLVNLTLRDLRGRYRRSALGWAWSLVTPLATIVIFTLVFRFVLRIPVPIGDPSGLQNFALFLVTGLVAWNFIANSVNGAMDALLGNSNLVKRVYFPRAVLVAASVASATVTLGIELSVLGAVLLLLGAHFVPYLPVLLFVIAMQALFVLGIALVLSAVNVYFRDLQYIVAILLQIGFYAAPIIYPSELVPERAEVLGLTLPVAPIYNLNPAVRFVEAYRDVLYHGVLPAATTIFFLVGAAAITMVLGIVVFHRLEPRLAEEL